MEVSACCVKLGLRKSLLLRAELRESANISEARGLSQLCSAKPLTAYSGLLHSDPGLLRSQTAIELPDAAGKLRHLLLPARLIFEGLLLGLGTKLGLCLLPALPVFKALLSGTKARLSFGLGPLLLGFERLLLGLGAKLGLSLLPALLRFKTL